MRWPARALDDGQRVLDHVEVAQAEEVHLQQPDLLDGLHRVLGDGAEDLRAVLPHAGVGELERDDVRQRAVGDDDGGGVDARVADDPLEALGDVDDLLGRRVLRHLGGELGARLEALLEARRAAHDRVGDELGEAVADAVVVAEDAGGVARGGAREHAAEGDDLGDALVAVLLRHVADHALAAADGEVDVDVRHRHALGVEEALEQQVVAERVDVRDLERVGDDAAGRRATARADRDAVGLRVGDEVVDDQEVGVEAHVADDLELHVGALLGLRRDRVAVALAEPLLHELAEVGLLGEAVRAVEARDQLLLERDRRVAALGDLERGGDRLRHVGERLRHLLRALQIELVGLEAHLRLGERRLRLHAQQGGVVVVVLLAEVVDVGGGDERAADLLGDLRDLLVDLLLLGDAVALDLEVDVLGAEDLDELVDVLAGLLRAALDDAPGAAARQAAGERDHAVGVALEQLEVDARLAAVQALGEAAAGELGEVAEALVAGGQEREVVALDLALADGAVVHEVGLEAEDRLDVVLLAGLVELDAAVHHAVVREAERGLPERRRAGGEAVDVRGAVEQRILGVNVQVRAGVGAHGVAQLRRSLGRLGRAARGVAAPCGKRLVRTPGRGRSTP